ncbi:hypothetical protein Tco_1287582, partial [Tanacetum coccineum]
MEKTRSKPKELLPYGMLLTRLFKHITQSDHGKKRPRESNAGSSPTTLNHPSLSHPLDDPIDDDDDDESFHSNSSSPSQNISSSSNVVSRVHQNPPHESHYLNTHLPETINLQTQQQDAHQEGLRSIGQALKNMMGAEITGLKKKEKLEIFILLENGPLKPPLPSSSYSPSSSMSFSNHHSNFSRKPRMSVRQVWKRKTSTPKSSPPSQNDSPPLPSRVYLQSPLPKSYNPLRDQMINQLHNVSTILDSHTNPSDAYIHAPPSPLPQEIHPPSHAQVEFHSSFCH